MKIRQITHQHRRDFSAIMECESCGNTEELKTGYDDRNYHDNVIPNFHCKKCGKSRIELGIQGEYTETKYPEGVQV